MPYLHYFQASPMVVEQVPMFPRQQKEHHEAREQYLLTNTCSGLQILCTGKMRTTVCST